MFYDFHFLFFKSISSNYAFWLPTSWTGLNNICGLKNAKIGGPEVGCKNRFHLCRDYCKIITHLCQRIRAVHTVCALPILSQELVDAPQAVEADSLEESHRGDVVIGGLVLSVEEEGGEHGEDAGGEREKDEKTDLAKKSGSNEAG